MSGFVNYGLDKGSMRHSEDRIQKIVDIYISAEAVRNIKHKKNTENCGTQTTETQTSQHTGSDCVKIRIYRAATVCLGLLCVLLLTAVIALIVYIYTNITNYTQERNELLINIANITEKRDELLTNNTNLTEKKNELIINNRNLLNEKNQLKQKNENLRNARNQLNNTLETVDGWTYYQFSFYYMSNETKNWNEGRRDCMKRGADLIIINNSDEQDFVMNVTRDSGFWIGVTDSEVEGSWKWVDGTNMTSGFWASKEPNGYKVENCVVTHLKEYPALLGWIDVSCNVAFRWICEKNILPLIQP